MIDAAVPSTFVGRRRLLRTAAAVTSGGLLAGFGVTAAAPAFAATAADCNSGNTVDASTDDAADIQTLLDADTAIVCLSGTFPITSTLTFDHDLTLFGLDAARLDGGSASQILVGSGAAPLTVQNLTFANGRAVEGGAILVQGDLTIENSAFVGNQSLEDGGAVYVRDNLETPDVFVSGSTFTNNSTGPAVDDVDGYSGGAIFVENFDFFDSLIEITGSTFTGNSASAFGGAVFAYGADIDTTTFDNNTALAGGALYSAVTVTAESTFSDNSAEFGGAVWALVYGVTFGSTFVANEANFAGGAIGTGLGGIEGGFGYGAVISANSTFVDNTAGEVGGAIFADYGQVLLSTFLENRAGTVEATEHSEAIFVTGNDDSLFVGGNIFAGSRTNAQIGQAEDGVVDDLGGNVFSTAESTEVTLDPADDSTQFSRSIADIFGADPQLRDNGGETETVALIGTSPAINAVPELVFGPTSANLTEVLSEFTAATEFTAAVDSVDVDQRNVERVGLADAGAYEYGEPELGSELADTGVDAAASSWLAGLAALLLGAGAAFAIGTRRLSRDAR